MIASEKILTRVGYAEIVETNRRIFLQIAILSLPIGLSRFFHLNKKPVTVVYHSAPKSHEHPKSHSSSFKSANDFWTKFYKGSALLFNGKNIQAGKVLSIKAELCSGGKAVRSEYIYRDRTAFMECERMWQSTVPKDPVQHTIVDIA